MPSESPFGLSSLRDGHFLVSAGLHTFAPKAAIRPTRKCQVGAGAGADFFCDVLVVSACYLFLLSREGGNNYFPSHLGEGLAVCRSSWPFTGVCIPIPFLSARFCVFWPFSGHVSPFVARAWSLQLFSCPFDLPLPYNYAMVA